MLALSTLFAAAFLSATILPGFSEAYMIGVYTSAEFTATTLVLVATTGNVAGSGLNYVMGRYLLKFKDRKWFPANDEQIAKGSKMYNKWGKWSLCFAWVPFFGDALTFAAGVFKTNIWLFLILVTIGKAGRYVFVMLVAQAII